MYRRIWEKYIRFVDRCATILASSINVTKLHSTVRPVLIGIKSVFKINKFTICTYHYLEAHEMPFSVAQRIIRKNTTVVGTFGRVVPALNG